MKDVLAAARKHASEEKTGAIVTIVVGEPMGRRALVDRDGSPLVSDLPDAVLGAAGDEIRSAIATEHTSVVSAGGHELFVDVITPPPTLRIFGGGPIAEALSRIAAPSGFKVIVGDPRQNQADPARFPDAAVVERGWPDDLLERRPIDHRSFVVSLLHEHRFEETLLPIVLRSEARYVGALGSRKTHASRLESLRTMGFDEEDLGRIHGPVGLAIGAKTPEEIAVAILAEMVQVRRST